MMTSWQRFWLDFGTASGHFCWIHWLMLLGLLLTLFYAAIRLYQEHYNSAEETAKEGGGSG